MTLEEFNRRILEPSVDKFLAERGQTREEFIAECDHALKPHRAVMHWARTGEWKDDA